ncbi:DNA replication and repair protein RecF [Halopseudomonas xinjiangensis]|uniref:DNA replication and repair protein RecF n=1 Tax=Halopseudomonas xinjiangensis TaxID=487184 RepID=A0A1H1XUJ1_9GAMM|nr:DNA replication/repair protein RecF [Halopseudomonas xinjiangensis]SDT12904.1 DNA replication and repair protein RecF [Halopseudomonas xinjiangensis]
MALTRIDVTGVRNLQPVTLHPSPRINIISGANGSGKTSLLEAIHILGLARSFRSTRLQPVIQYEKQSCTVYGELQSGSSAKHSLGVTRDREADYQIRIDGRTANAASELATILPLQLINPDSFRLLEGAPKQRRQFLDWGVFHVEHQFLATWQRLQKALKQRNSLLRRGRIDRSVLAVWDSELVAAGERIDAFRQHYISRLKPVFEATLGSLLDLEGLSLSYNRGWDKDRTLQAVLESQLDRDVQIGHTQAGPQRADLRLRIRGLNAVEVLSRGQQKLVVSAMKIAQGVLLKDLGRGSSCLYLVDDLPSELDKKHREALCQLLSSLECQIFITCVEASQLHGSWDGDTPLAMFHVEHGHIMQTE